MILDLNKIVLRITPFVFLLLTSLFSQNETNAQTYVGEVTFGSSNQYSFDFEIICDVPPTSATLTVTFTSALPPQLVPQLHLGGGVFVSMSGSNPYTYNLTGMTDCEFSFFFWMAYTGGGLYQSSQPVTTNNTALPIFLSAFNAKAIDASSAELNWTSHTEINSDRFNIERSIDGINWEKIGEVQAAGNSSSLITYSYLDLNVINVSSSNYVFYYRLKMIDLDGTYEYSEVRAVSFENYIEDLISIFPNPTQDFLTIDLTRFGMSTGNIDLMIYDVTGRLIISKQLELNTIEKLDLLDFHSGTYELVLMRNRENIYQSSVVKVN